MGSVYLADDLRLGRKVALAPFMTEAQTIIDSMHFGSP